MSNNNNNDQSSSINKTFGYVRVSTKEQNTDRQIAEILKYVENERDIFIDKASGRNFEREQYNIMKKSVRRGDTVYIKSLDRFGRNKEAIKRELEYYKDKGVFIKCLDLPTTLIDFSQYGSTQRAILEMINNVLIEVIGMMAEQELNYIKQRQAEGIKEAKKKGKKFGRPSLQYPPAWKETYGKWKDKEITAKTAMEALSLPRTSFYKLVNRYEQEQE